MEEEEIRTIKENMVRAGQMIEPPPPRTSSLVGFAAVV